MKQVEGKRSPKWAFMERMVIPCENGENYLTRLRIIQTPWFGIYLHDLSAPDSDPNPHDHPWDFISIILRGSYLEKVHPIPHVIDSVWYKRRWHRWTWHKMSTDKAHRILSVEPGTISLLLVGKRKRDWGFFVDGAWVNWRDHETVK